jgi:hypothetical protein
MKAIREAIKSLDNREETCWAMARVFLENRDAHGVMDMGAELQSLQRAKAELVKLGE